MYVQNIIQICCSWDIYSFYHCDMVAVSSLSCELNEQFQVNSKAIRNLFKLASYSDLWTEGRSRAAFLFCVMHQ